MTQYDDTVERQRLMLEAEEWAGKTKGVHAHSIDSMYYDDRPQDTAGMTKSVTDHEFNDGTVRRYQGGELIHTFGKKLTREEMLDAYTRSGS